MSEMSEAGNAAEPTNLVELRGVTKRYGSVSAVLPLDLDIRRGEFLAILGPSGCGKTTLLRLIGGMLEPTGGTLAINGEDVTKLGPERRPTNMVFQGYGLFPHMTVAQNIAYGLRIAKVAQPETEQRVRQTVELVHLEGFEARGVTELSGGQQQRVALARALIMRPEVLLLDEPLAALDLKLRKAMQQELRRIHQTTGGTFVFVTHDQEEAMGLATRICVMDDGRIVQQGGPEEIYSTPKTRFVSSFIGEANVLGGTRKANLVTLGDDLHFNDPGPDEPIVTIIRPEKVRIAVSRHDQSLSGCEVSLTGTLTDAVFLGPSVKYNVDIGNGSILTVDSRDIGLRDDLVNGGKVVVAWRLADQQVLPAT